MDINVKNLPLWAKIIISVLPAVIITVLVIFLVIKPKQQEIKTLDAKIDEQNNKIAASESKVAKLEVLKMENARLLSRLNELKEQLPEEKEISSLLKQVSDLGIGSGLEIKSWKPGQRTTHPSGIVYVIPVSVNVTGTYHKLGHFLSSLTRLNRIVNIRNMNLASPKAEKQEVILQVSFTAATFTAVPEDELPKTGAGS
jgi:type IV pilus assembly protein PilO